MKRWLSYFLVLTLLFITASTVIAANADEKKVNDKKNELSDVNSDIKKTKNELERVKKEQKAVSSQLTSLEDEIEQKEAEIQQNHNELEKTQSQLKDTQSDLEKAIENANEQEAKMAERLRIMFMNNPSDYLELLMEAKNLNDFMDRMEIAKKLIQYDNDVLGTLKDHQDEVQEKKLQLEDQERRITKIKAELIEQNNVLRSKRKQRESLLAKLLDQEEQFEDDLDKLEKTSKDLEKKIQELLRELERKKQQNVKYTGGVLTWPVPGFYRITSPYGYRPHPVYNTVRLHTGIDIGSNIIGGVREEIYGRDFVAGADGTVLLAIYYGGYGNCVIIDHGGGVTTLYAHGSRILVHEGQKVKRGQAVLKVGSTGVSTGAHAHFEVRKNGVPVDPMTYLK